MRRRSVNALIFKYLFAETSQLAVRAHFHKCCENTVNPVYRHAGYSDAILSSAGFIRVIPYATPRILISFFIAAFRPVVTSIKVNGFGP